MMEKEKEQKLWDRLFGFKEGDYVFWQFKRDNRYFMRKYGRIIRFTSMSIVVEEEDSGILVYFKSDEATVH